jgi:hypothetical protein
LEGRKAEKDRFLHIFPAFLPSKESVLRSVSGNRISTKCWKLIPAQLTKGIATRAPHRKAPAAGSTFNVQHQTSNWDSASY